MFQQQEQIPNIFDPSYLPPKVDEQQLPPPVDLLRARILKKIPLGEFLLGDSAMRSYGTAGGVQAGATVGASLGPGGALIGGALGGYAGNRLMQAGQELFPGVLGEPPVNPNSTAITDTVLYGMSKPISTLVGKLIEKGMPGVAAWLGKKMGTDPAKQTFTHPLNPEYVGYADKPIRDAITTGFPTSVGQVKDSVFASELEKIAPNSLDLQDKQLRFILGESKDLTKTKAGTSIPLKSGRDATAFKATINSGTLITPKFLRSASTNTTDFFKLTKLIGEQDASAHLWKDTLEQAFDKSTGGFNPSKLADLMYRNRDVFNFNAKQLSKSTGAKASDLKASWNRFLWENILYSRGKKVSERGMDIAASNAGLSTIVAIPMLGPMSYPVARGGATAAKFMLFGPRLGKAFSDPEVVQALTNLRRMPAGNPGIIGNVRKIAAWSIKNGVPLTTVGGVDGFLNPSMEFTPIEDIKKSGTIDTQQAPIPKLFN
jgi:hypothetical protein